MSAQILHAQSAQERTGVSTEWEKAPSDADGYSEYIIGGGEEA